jgi:DNA-binding NarL/FixJ family response regulator
MMVAFESEVRVLLVDDNALIRVGLRHVLEPVADIKVVAEAADGEEALLAAEASSPDVALVDVKMPLMDGLTLAERLKDRCQVVMLTNSDDPRTVTEALRRGACGYLVHGTFDPQTLAQVVRDAARGGSMLSPGAAAAVLEQLRDPVGRRPDPGPFVFDRPPAIDDATPIDTRGGFLSDREAEIMGLIANGLSNPEIAARLYLAPKTVKNHVNRIFAKLGAPSRARAITRWLGTEEPEAPSS